jgi:SPP1 family predicted phage head-tail adaptor
MAPGYKIKMMLQQKSEVSNGMGGFTTTWVGIKELKGSLIYLKAKEGYSNNVTSTVSTHFFQCNFPKDVTVTEEDRLVYDGDIYEITLSENVSKRNISLYLELKKVK